MKARVDVLSDGFVSVACPSRAVDVDASTSLRAGTEPAPRCTRERMERQVQSES